MPEKNKSNISAQRLIDRALHKNLSAAERQAFRVRLQDPAFRESYETQKMLFELGQKRPSDDLLDMPILDRHLARKREVGASWKGAWGALLLVALLSMLAAVLLQGCAGDPSKRIFKTYYEPFPNNVDPIEAGADPTSPFQLYELGRYDEAIQGLATIGSSEHSWFLAQSYLATNQLKDAETIFTTFYTDRRSKYHTEAHWYLALTHLKQGNNGAATPLLETLAATPNNAFGSKSADILAQIQGDQN